jgi:glycine/D-amino acid oxidase-like deaminating enzyme/nitrite reductase/ring-hydroxylating ferredoxin subunit
MQHQTMWGRRESADAYPTLDADLQTPILIVGGGITGLALARELQLRGHAVSVVELRRVGLGTTGHSSGHLDITTDMGMSDVVSAFDLQAGKAVIEASERALDRAHRWSAEHGIDCDLRRVPAYLYAEGEDEVRTVEEEAKAYRDIGSLLDRKLIDRRKQVPLPFATQGGIRFSDQIRFDPLDFTRGLARVFVRDGGRLFEGTRVRRIHDRKDGVTVETASGRIEAEHVVLATHAPLFGFLSLQSRAHPFQSYVIAVKVRTDIEDALYWDEKDPYHYTRVLDSADPRLLLIGGADHRTGDVHETDKCFDALLAYADQRFGIDTVVGRWSHEYFNPSDKLPYVGRLPARHRTYVATGFSGDGLQWGIVTAEVLADAIEGRENALADVLTPSRIKPLASARELGAGGAYVARHAVGDHLAFADVDTLEEIPRGEGRLIRLGLRRLAVFRDDAGSLHAMSPVCRHAGCIVQWNAAAKTWDCPCHGGRYDAHGRVIAAPPKDDLEPQELG